MYTFSHIIYCIGKEVAGDPGIASYKQLNRVLLLALLPPSCNSLANDLAHSMVQMIITKLLHEDNIC
jgi:hypothetical protein